MYIKREIEDVLSPYLDRREAIAILGPRQVGKTTLLYKIQKDILQKGKKVKYITFEDRSNLRLFEDSIEDFKDSIINYDFIIIDEFQYAKDCGQKLKYLYDTTNIKFIITGSAALDLKHKVAKYMVGRMLDFHLWPFSFREYLRANKDDDLLSLLNKRISGKDPTQFNITQGFGKEINSRLAAELEKFVIFGGYPAVVLSDTSEIKQRVLENILDKFLLKDIKTMLELATDDKLLKLAKILALQIGNGIKYRNLANIINLTEENIKKHLNILEKTFILKLIPPFYTNKKVEIVKNPEPFFHDLGLRNALIYDFRKLDERVDMGAIMENYAFVLLRNLQLVPELKFWRTKSQAEVDFVIERGQDKIPVEVKYTSGRKVGKSFYSFIDKYKPPIGIIFTKDYLAQETINDTLVKFIPLSYF